MTNKPEVAMNSQHNQQSIGILARLCAQENITIRHKAGLKTASFDVKNRVLYLPIWAGVSRDLIDMLVIHEVGHALDTPADGWIDGVKAIAERQFKNVTNRKIKAVHGFANVLEDVRVDKRQKRRFPGSVRNYVAAYKELFQRDFFQIKNRDINSMAFIDRLNIFTKGGALLGIKFSAVEKAFIKKAQETETFPEVLALTEEVFAWSRLHDPAFQNDKREKIDIGEDMRELLKELLGDIEEGESDEDMEDSYPDISDSDEDEDEEKDFDFDDQEDSVPGQETDAEESEEVDAEESDDAKAPDKPADDSDEDAVDSEDEDEDSVPAPTKEEEREFDKDKETEDKSADESEDEESDDEVPESETDSAWDIATQTIIAGKDDQYVYVNVPEPKLEMIVDDYKKVVPAWSKALSINDSNWMRVKARGLNEWKAKEAKSISYLLKEFDMRKAADIYVRSATAKTGRIDTNKLHAYKYSEDIFKRIAVEPKGSNHGFFMILDWSMSMDSCLHETVKQLLSMVLFCKRAQMPFEVYLFRDCINSESNDGNDYWNYGNGNYLVLNAFKLRNVLSSRMSQSELQQAMLNLWCGAANSDRLTYTPLHEAVVAAIPLINRFRKENNLQIVNTITLTDGGSDWTPYSSEAHQEVREATYANSKVKTTYIIQDKISKKEIYTNDQVKTEHLLDILKARTNSNVLGFYLFEFGLKSVIEQFSYMMPVAEQKNVKTKWEEDKFISVNSIGYDEYFIINMKDIKYKRIVPKPIDNTMTKRKVEKAFMENVKASAVNRVLLRRFAERIAKQQKTA